MPLPSRECCETWGEECFKQSAGAEHTDFRERLLSLEGIHGEAVRERFPPEHLHVGAEE